MALVGSELKKFVLRIGRQVLLLPGDAGGDETLVTVQQAQVEVGDVQDHPVGGGATHQHLQVMKHERPFRFRFDALEETHRLGLTLGDRR